MILICHIVLILLMIQHTDINQYVSGEKFFQNEVFGPMVENPLFQEHLALTPGQRVQSQ